MNKFFEDLSEKAANRRSFVRNISLAGAALGAVGTNALGQTSTPSDADIVNFALNLEYLEAEFYTAATTGQTLSQMGYDLTGTGNAGATTGGAKVPFTDSTIQAVANQLAIDERSHVVLLRGALQSLGLTPVAKPAIKLDALGIGFANQNDFLALSRSFEDLGVSAYAGAAPLIQNKTVLGYAARILAAEAYHAGNIRLLVAQNKIATKPLDGADHLPPPSGAQYFDLNSMGLAEIRTPGQVLYIAYGGVANGLGGGFFPNGVNGTLNVSSSTSAVTDGASITVTPNPIPVGSSNVLTGSATVAWNAPNAQVIEIHVGSPTGPIFTRNINKGSMVTGNWVTDGTTFYLIDVSSGAASGNVIATAVVHLTTSTTTTTP